MSRSLSRDVFLRPKKPKGLSLQRQPLREVLLGYGGRAPKSVPSAQRSRLGSEIEDQTSWANNSPICSQYDSPGQRIPLMFGVFTLRWQLPSRDALESELNTSKRLAQCMSCSLATTTCTQIRVTPRNHLHVGTVLPGEIDATLQLSKGPLICA